jgi:hypothetical protein
MAREPRFFCDRRSATFPKMRLFGNVRIESASRSVQDDDILRPRENPKNRSATSQPLGRFRRFRFSGSRVNRVYQKFRGVERGTPLWGRRPFRAKTHGSVLHAMSRAGADAAVSYRFSRKSKARVASWVCIARNKSPVCIGAGLNPGSSGQNRRNFVRVHVSYRAFLRARAFRPVLAKI